MGSLDDRNAGAKRKSFPMWGRKLTDGSKLRHFKSVHIWSCSYSTIFQ